jgi:hypothetical protein
MINLAQDLKSISYVKAHTTYDKIIKKIELLKRDTLNYFL